MRFQPAPLQRRYFNALLFKLGTIPLSSGWGCKLHYKQEIHSVMTIVSVCVGHRAGFVDVQQRYELSAFAAAFTSEVRFAN